VRGSGEGRSKKQAEQAAARDAWGRLAAEAAAAETDEDGGSPGLREQDAGVA
jgi:hypothetical protein